MFVNYFQDLFKILAESFLFSFKKFKTLMPYMWIMIIIQVISYMSILWSVSLFEQNLINIKNILVFIFALILYFVAMFFMYKKVLSFLALEQNEEEFSCLKTLKALLTLTIFNLIPVLVFILGIFASSFFFNLSKVFMRCVNIFSIVFYISMSLALVEIARQKANNFVAVLKSIKFFFKNIFYTLPLFFIVYVLAFVLKFIVLALVIYVFWHLKVLFVINNLNFLDSILSVLSIYFYAVLYLGVQLNLVKNLERK